MATQLLLHERIETTLPKAKELRKMADKLVTLGKAGARSYTRTGTSWSQATAAEALIRSLWGLGML